MASKPGRHACSDDLVTHENQETTTQKRCQVGFFLRPLKRGARGEGVHSKNKENKFRGRTEHKQLNILPNRTLDPMRKNGNARQSRREMRSWVNVPLRGKKLKKRNDERVQPKRQ